MNLFRHGITHDESDYRVHVGFRVGAIYVFPTESGKKAILSKKHRETGAGQLGVSSLSSHGVVVPWQQIEGCIEVMIPDCLLKLINCKPTESTSVKGRNAVRVVQLMQTQGLLPIKFSLREVQSKAIQLKGADLKVHPAIIQVKCDYGCGATARGGTGNLYLETHEQNPLKLY